MYSKHLFFCFFYTSNYWFVLQSSASYNLKNMVLAKLLHVVTLWPDKVPTHPNTTIISKATAAIKGNCPC